MIPKKKRRHGAFGLRCLFMLFILFSLVLTGFSYRYREFRSTYDKLCDLGPAIELAYPCRLPEHESETLAFVEDFFCTPAVVEVQFHGNWSPPHPPGIAISSYSFVICNNIDDARLKTLVELLTCLRKCPKLSLIGTDVTDKGLKEFQRLHTLEDLVLRGTKITSIGLQSLETLHLTSLDLSYTDISNRDISVIANLDTLKSLNVSHSQITGDGVIRLKSKLPDCIIINDEMR